MYLCVLFIDWNLTVHNKYYDGFDVLVDLADRFPSIKEVCGCVQWDCP